MKLIKQILWILNWALALLLFISYLANYITPESASLPSFLGLAFPLLLIINIIFVIFWLIFSTKKIFLSLAVIILGIGHIGRFWQLSENKLPENEKIAVKIMSYNVQLFGLYDWKDNIKVKDSIFDFIQKENPGILCLQEYYERNFEGFKTTSKLKKILNSDNIHKANSLEINNGQKFGIATFLNYPVVNKGKVNFKDTYNMFIFTDFLWGKDTVRIYNLHLQSVHLSADNYKNVDSIDFPNLDKSKISNYNDIRKKLLYAFKRRARQSLVVEKHISESPYPVIICGDFNAPPLSYSYHHIGKNMKDAFKAAGKGFGFSYERKYLKMRIDHILFDNKFKAYNFKSTPVKFSDHFPVSCYLKKDE